MPNFAINTSESEVARGKALITALVPEGKQSEGLSKMFDIVETSIQEAQIASGGADIIALHASVRNIYSQFASLVEGRDEIISQKNAEISTIKNTKDDMESDLRRQLATVTADKKQAEQTAASATKEKNAAIQDAQSARSQMTTFQELVEEKDTTINTLAEKLAASETKANGYDDLNVNLQSAQKKISELQRILENAKARSTQELKDTQLQYEAALQKEQYSAKEEIDRLTYSLAEAKKEAERSISAMEKDHEIELTNLRHEMNHALTTAESKAALSTERAVHEKEIEMGGIIQSLRDHISRLETQLEMLQSDK